MGMTTINMIDREHLKAQLVRHEDEKLKLYLDPMGIPTIGVGRNLLAGISHDESMYLLDNDIDTRVRWFASNYGWFPMLDPVRQAALINMAFMGVEKVAKFTRMLTALARHDYDRAADEMLASKWAQQVGHRAAELAEQMRTGAWA